MNNRSTAQVVTGAASLTGPSTTLMPTATVMLAAAATVFVGSRSRRVTAAVGNHRLQRVCVQKFVMTGRRQNHRRLVETRRTLRNQVLRTARFLC